MQSIALPLSYGPNLVLLDFSKILYTLLKTSRRYLRVRVLHLFWDGGSNKEDAGRQMLCFKVDILGNNGFFLYTLLGNELRFTYRQTNSKSIAHVQIG